MATRPRTTEDIRNDIAREREQLVRAVEELRADVTSFKAKLPLYIGVAVGAFVAYKLLRRRFSSD